MKNNLADLNNHLFAMLESLADEDAMEDPGKAAKEIARAKSMCMVSSQIVSVARTQLQAVQTAENCGLLNKELPSLVQTRALT